MLAYLRRLLEPPRLKDIWLWLGILIASQELTTLNNEMHFFQHS